MKVMQCWDDGPATDIRLLELLRKYEAKATFNLCPGLMRHLRIPLRKSEMTEGPDCWVKGYYFGRVGLSELAEVYSGFQVASHCWNHEIAGRVPDKVFLQAAVNARKYLEDVLQKPCLGFAWPCNGHTPETAELLRQAGFLYGRTTENTEDVMHCDNPLLLKSSCHFLAPDFMERYQAAKKTGVFYFWGHSWQMLDYDSGEQWARMERILQMIQQDPEAEWADVSEVAELLWKNVSKGRGA